MSERIEEQVRLSPVWSGKPQKMMPHPVAGMLPLKSQFELDAGQKGSMTQPTSLFSSSPFREKAPKPSSES